MTFCPFLSLFWIFPLVYLWPLSFALFSLYDMTSFFLKKNLRTCYVKKKKNMGSQGNLSIKRHEANEQDCSCLLGWVLNHMLGSFNALLVAIFHNTPRWLQAAAMGIGQFAYDDGCCSHALPSATSTLGQLLPFWCRTGQQCPARPGGDLSQCPHHIASFWF